jgi:23S rRNA (uracil1939-C5)-methyltransferase
MGGAFERAGIRLSSPRPSGRALGHEGEKTRSGFRAAGSQDIVAIDQCPVLVQPLQPIMTGLPEMLRRLSKPQALGHVELFSGSSLAVLLRHMAPLSESDLTILKNSAVP